MLSESQIHNFKKVGSEGDYESSANLPGQDHTYQGLNEAKGATNKAFGQSNHDSSDDYDSPHDPVSNDYVTPLAWDCLSPLYCILTDLLDKKSSLFFRPNSRSSVCRN